MNRIKLAPTVRRINLHVALLRFLGRLLDLHGRARSICRSLGEPGARVLLVGEPIGEVEQRLFTHVFSYVDAGLLKAFYSQYSSEELGRCRLSRKSHIGIAEKVIRLRA